MRRIDRPLLMKRPLFLAPPNLASVRLLMHHEGADLSTTFVDSSALAQTLNAQGGAKISTAQFRFGASSGVFNGTTDYVKSATPANFNDLFAGTATVAGWVRPNAGAAATQRFIFSINQNLTGGFQWLGMYLTGAGNTLGATVSGTSSAAVVSTVPVPTGSWTHVAMSRDAAGYVRIAQDGVITGSSPSPWPTYSNSVVQHVAAWGMANGYTDSSILHFSGNGDELLVTSECLFTANFTPPPSPYS